MEFTRTGKRIFKKKSFVQNAIKSGKIMPGLRAKKVKGGFIASK